MEYVLSLVQPLGWTLIHSFWQSTLILGLAFLIVYLFKVKRSEIRYVIYLISMLCMVFCSIFTFHYLSDIRILQRNITSEAKLSHKLQLAEQETILNDFFIHLERVLSDLVPILLLFWFVFVLYLGTKFLLLMGRNFRIKKTNEKVDNQWGSLLKELQDKLNISRNIKLHESKFISTPCVLGFIKPIIFLPVSAFTQLNSEIIEMILLHELAHIKRNDYIVNLIQTVLDIMFFFNPSFRWLSEQIRIERELSCDDIVLETTDNPIAYAKSLASLETFRAHSSFIRNEASVAFLGQKKSLKYRIKRLFNEEEPNQFKPIHFFVVASLIFVLFGASLENTRPYIDKNTKLESTQNWQKLNSDTVRINRVTSTGLFSDLNVKTLFVHGSIKSATVNGVQVKKADLTNYAHFLNEEKKIEKDYLESLNQVSFHEEKIRILREELTKNNPIEGDYFEITVKNSTLFINNIPQSETLHKRYLELENKHFKQIEIDNLTNYKKDSGYINIKTTIK